MRTGWLVLLAFAAAGVGSVAGLSTTDKRTRLFDVFLVGMYVAWVGMGLTAAVMLARGVPQGGFVRGVERTVLWLVACLGLFPVLYLALIAVGGWEN